MEHKLNKLKLFFFIISISLVSYFFLVFTSIIDPSLSLDSEYCNEYADSHVVDDIRIGQTYIEGGECISFRSALDEQIFNYNQGVSNRKHIWLILTLIIMVVASKLIIPLYYPNKEERWNMFGYRERSEKYAVCIGLIFFSLIGVIILQFILPEPADNLPFITHQLDKWEDEMKKKIISGQIYITSEGKVINR